MSYLKLSLFNYLYLMDISVCSVERILLILIPMNYCLRAHLKIFCHRPPNYGKGDKAAVTAVVSGNIYLARQLFFILLTIICVSKIQIRHSDKSGSLQWAWVSAFNYNLLKIQWWIPACTTLFESQIILTTTVPKTLSLFQKLECEPSEYSTRANR